MLSVFLFSCASTQEREERERANFFDVRTTTDEFRKLTFYSGHHVGGRYKNYQIDAASRDKSAPTYRINLFTRYFGSWIFYNTAFDSNGNKLEIINKEREYDSTFTEDIMLKVSRKYLENNSSGITIKLFNDKAESILFNIPGEYIENFLSKTQSIVKID
jgi:hypothetical protein